MAGDAGRFSADSASSFVAPSLRPTPPPTEGQWLGRNEPTISLVCVSAYCSWSPERSLRIASWYRCQNVGRDRKYARMWPLSPLENYTVIFQSLGLPSSDRCGILGRCVPSQTSCLGPAVRHHAEDTKRTGCQLTLCLHLQTRGGVWSRRPEEIIGLEVSPSFVSILFIKGRCPVHIDVAQPYASKGHPGEVYCSVVYKYPLAVSSIPHSALRSHSRAHSLPTYDMSKGLSASSTILSAGTPQAYTRSSVPGGRGAHLAHTTVPHTVCPLPQHPLPLPHKLLHNP